MKFNVLYTAITAALITIATSCDSDNDNNDGNSTVPTPVAVESITLDRSDITLVVGETASITVHVSPDDAEYDQVIWNSSDPKTASVDNDGTVTALADGTASITAEAGGKTATCTVTVTDVTAPAQIGDYYYSDGTWSTEPDKSKTIIGIVFWTGNPTADDAVLAKDHPECTHGLVVSLDQQVSAWQTNYEAYGKTVSEWIQDNAPGFSLPITAGGIDDPIQKIVGYNNTKAIEAFNASFDNSQWPVDAVSASVTYRTAVKAPSETSDWYLPSPKELSLLCCGELTGNIVITQPVMTNVKLINAQIEKIKGAPISKNSFWSSSEAYNPQQPLSRYAAWNYYFNDDMKIPLSYSFKDWNEYARVRFVLAF